MFVVRALNIYFEFFGKCFNIILLVIINTIPFQIRTPIYFMDFNP